MYGIDKKIDKIVQLTPEENILIFDGENKHTQFTINKALRHHELKMSQVETATLAAVINDAVKQIEFFMIQFPEHDEPPIYLFDYTLEAFLHRRTADQWAYEQYEELNSPEHINMAKLYVDYQKCLPIMNKLIEEIKHKGSFESLQRSITLMNELDHFLRNLDKETEDNIKLLRKREIEFKKLFLIKIRPSQQIKDLDYAFENAQNEYDDYDIVIARQLRYNTNLLNAKKEQAVWQTKDNLNELTDELSELNRLCDQERKVFDQSSRYNLMEIKELKEKVVRVSKKYETDLINVEFQIGQDQSNLNDFEEMWNRKRIEMEFMKQKSDEYIESVFERKREAFAKRFAKIWIESARATIANQKAKVLLKRKKDKKNKNKKKK